MSGVLYICTYVHMSGVLYMVVHYRGSPYVWCHGQSGRNDASHTRRSTRPRRVFLFLLLQESDFFAGFEKTDHDYVSVTLRCCWTNLGQTDISWNHDYHHNNPLRNPNCGAECLDWDPAVSIVVTFTMDYNQPHFKHLDYIFYKHCCCTIMSLQKYSLQLQ